MLRQQSLLDLKILNIEKFILYLEKETLVAGSNVKTESETGVKTGTGMLLFTRVTKFAIVSSQNKPRIM